MYKNDFELRGFGAEFNSLNFDKVMCFDNTIPDIILGGNFNMDYFSNLNVRMRRCVNSTTATTICKSKEEIDNRLLKAAFQFYYFNYDVDLNNYKDPYKLTLSHYFIKTDPIATKFIDVYFKTVNISTDAGLVIQSDEYKSEILYDTNKDQILVQIVDNLIIDYYINSTNYTISTKSTLKKSSLNP